MGDFNKDGLRTFYSDSKAANFYIASPTAEDIRNADYEYSKSYTKSLLAGITTASEMTDILRRRGIIGPEFDKRSEELSMELALKVEALANVKTNEEKAELATQVAIAREELFNWNQRLHAPLSNTCEQMADDTRLEYLTSALVVDEFGNKVWNSFDAYLTEPDQSMPQQARLEVMLFLQGLESDFLDQTPEAIAMRQVQEDAATQIAKEIIAATTDTATDTTEAEVSTAVESSEEVEDGEVVETAKKPAAKRTKRTK